MDTLRRTESRTAPSGRLEVVGHALVVVGFALAALGMFEIGGLFNVGLGLAVACVGCLLLFARAEDHGLDEREFLRQLEEL
jgi:hypothetical protein